MTYAVTLRDVRAGPAEPYILADLDGAVGQAVRSTRQARPSGGARALGFDRGDTRDVVAQITVSAATDVATEAAVWQLVAAWAPSTVDLELLVELSADSGRVLVGRPAGIDVDLAGLPNGFVETSARFEVLDPLWYAAVDRFVMVTMPVDAGGITTPITTPITAAGGGTTGDAIVTNNGTAPAPWQATLNGPLTTPRVSHQRVRRPNRRHPRRRHLRRRRLTHPIRHRRRPGPAMGRAVESVWVDLAPGPSQFSLRASAGTGTAVLTWRDTYY